MLTGMAAWVVASVLWTVNDWPNGWGPDPSVGLSCSRSLGAGMVVPKFWLAGPPVSRRL